MDLVRIAEIFGTPEQARAAAEGMVVSDFRANKIFLGDTVSGERLCCGLSLFESMMKELQKTLLEDKEWKGMKPPANGCIYIEESQEFHRIWSACQWIMARVSAQF